jgi:hypothetical protein
MAAINDLSKNDWSELKALLDVPLQTYKNLTAMLVNEEDEQGPVQIVNEHGTVVYLMPRKVYDEIRAWKAKSLER